MSPQSVNTLSTASQAVEDGRFHVIYWKKRFDVRHLSPNPVLATLDVEYNELVKAWKRLQELLPHEDQVPFRERPQNTQDVHILVRSIQTSWASHPQRQLFSRSMSLCDVFLATVKSHTIPLATLPSHQFYSSLFYATLQSIIKASANYPRTMDGVMRALVRINQSVCPAIESEPIQFTRESIPSIAKFYSLIFLFLGELMDWYARRFKCRLLKSLYEDVYLDFYGLVSTIQSAARDFVQDFAHASDLNDSDYERTKAIMQYPDLYLWEEARLSQLGRRHIDRRFAAQNALTRLLLWEIQRDAEQRSRLMEKRVVLLSQMFDTAGLRIRLVSQENSGITGLATNLGQDLDYSPSPSETPKRKYTRVELQLASAHLQDYFDCDDQVADFEPNMEVMVDESVMESLKQWITNACSQILAIGDSSNPGSASPVSLIAACFAQIARDASLPVVAHFCSVPVTTKDGLTLFQQGLIALVYSLIRQLIDHLPPVANGTSTCTVKAERFTLLDGTLASWKEVLSLIDTLLYYAPPLLVCVVDGLDKLQDPSTDEHIQSLVRTLMNKTRHQSDLTPGRQSVLLKALFTVTGQPDSLLETLSENTHTLNESNGTDKIATSDTPLSPDGEIMIDA